MAAACSAAHRGAPRRAWLALALLVGGCVDKAPPPMWPAPPPPRIAAPLHADEAAPPVVPVPVVGAPTLAVPGPLDTVPADASILDPDGPAAAAVPKPTRTSPRPVPTHK